MSCEDFVNLAYKRLKIGPAFSPTLRKFCILLRYQALHSTNRTQPNVAKREEV